MKLKIEKKELEKKSRLVLPATSAKSTMDILGAVKIKADDTGIHLLATDLALGICTKVEGEIIEQGEVAVDAKLFADFVRKMPDGDVKLEVDETNTVKISCKKTKLKVAGKDAEQFPNMQTTANGDVIAIKQSAFRDVLSGVIFAVAENDNNKMMTGVNIKVKNKEIKFCALDGHRIAIKTLTTDVDLEKDVTVPSSVLKEVQKLLSAKADAVVELNISSNLIVFALDDTVLTGRLIEGPYYQYEAMINDIKETVLTINKKELMDSLDRSVLFTTAMERKPVKLFIHEEGVNVSIDSRMIGSMDEQLEGEKEGKDLVIGFNPSYLLDALKAIDDEDVTIQFVNPKAPCIIKGEDYLYLTLPVSIKEAAANAA